jgi:hypothetical protein
VLYFVFFAIASERADLGSEITEMFFSEQRGQQSDYSHDTVTNEKQMNKQRHLFQQLHQEYRGLAQCGWYWTSEKGILQMPRERKTNTGHCRQALGQPEIEG